MVDVEFKNFYSRIQNKMKRRKKKGKRIISWLMVGMVFLIIASIQSVIVWTDPVLMSIVYLVSAAIGLICVFISFYRLSEVQEGDLRLSIRERLFYYLFNTHSYLHKCSTPTDFDHQENVIKSLDKIENYLSGVRVSSRTGFDSDKLGKAINSLYDSIQKFKKDINDADSSVIMEYVGFFHKLMAACYDGDSEKFLNIVMSKHETPEINRFFLFIKKFNKISLRNIFKYVISFIITILLSWIIVTSFNIPLWESLGSALAAIVAFAALVRGFKYVIDQIDIFFSKNEN